MASVFIIADINGIDTQISRLETINKEIQQEILAVLSVVSVESAISTRRQQSAKNQQVISDLYAKKNSLLKAKYDAVENCRDVIKGDLREIYNAMKDMLLVSRKELGFPINEKEYSILIDQSTTAALVSIHNLYKEIRTQVKQKFGQY